MIMYPPPFAIFNDTMTDESESSSIILSSLLGIVLSLIAFTTAMGNIIVLLAFYCDKKLRTINGRSSRNLLFLNSFLFLYKKKIISYWIWLLRIFLLDFFAFLFIFHSGKFSKALFAYSHTNARQILSAKMNFIFFYA